MARDPDKACSYVFFSYNSYFYALSLHPTKEPISAKAELLALSGRRRIKNSGVFSSFGEKNIPYKENHMGA